MEEKQRRIVTNIRPKFGETELRPTSNTQSIRCAVQFCAGSNNVAETKRVTNRPIIYIFIHQSLVIILLL